MPSKPSLKKPPKTKSKAQLQRERGIRMRQKAAAQRQRACELFQSGMSQVRISEELGISGHGIRRWLQEAGILPPRGAPRTKPEEPEPEPDTDPFEERLEAEAQKTIDEAVSLGDFVDARDAEQQALLETAQNQASPADQYQAYVASMGIRMMRDNIMNVRGPRTVRELAELDQLIRRSMGLNPKGEGRGGGGSLTIDINILNNAKAARGGSSVVVDVEPESEAGDEEGGEDDW